MKKLSYILTGFMLAFFCIASQKATAFTPDASASNITTKSSLEIMSTPELMKLTTNWVKEYKKLYPDADISVSELNEKVDFTHLSFISGEYTESLSGESTWKMAVGRDAIVHIYNTKNPYADAIKTQGFTADRLAQLFANPNNQNWGILNPEYINPIEVSFAGNSEILNQMAEFLKLNSDEINVKAVNNTSSLIQSVQQNIYGLGVCRLVDIIDQESGTFMANIGILPIDRNRNGKIDHFENIYETPDAFTRGIWTGKYPVTLTGNIYAVAATQPTDETTVALLTWINGQGQDMLNLYGFSDLSSNEKQANINLLVAPEEFIGEMEATTRTAGWIKILLAIIAVSLAAYGIVVYQKKRRPAITAESFKMSPALNVDLINAPGGLYYDKTHTWAFMEKDGTVRIGIDDFLQHITGPLTRVKMKDPGEKVRKGEKIVTIIRDGKQLEIYAPVSGIIREQNNLLMSDSSKINSSPYTDGWLYTIEPINWAREIQFMFMGNDYKEWLTEEFSRLKDFFAASVQSNEMVYEHVVLQDGGEITDNVLSDLGPEVWEDFQTKFIDTSR